MKSLHFLVLLLLILSLGLVVLISCGDDDDDDDDDDDTSGADDDDDNDDDVFQEICKNGDLLTNHAEISVGTDCTECHGSSAAAGHGGVYDDDSPDSCLAVGCHGC